MPITGGAEVSGFNYVILAVLVGAAFFTDMKDSRIPNNLVIAGVFAGILVNLTRGLEGFVFSLQGMAFGFTVLLLLYLMGGVGAGDVKLFAAIGAITGVGYTLSSLVYALFAAAFIGSVLVIIRGEFIMRMKRLFYSILLVLTLGRVKIISNFKETTGFRFPFMYAVLPGVILAYFLPVLI